MTVTIVVPKEIHSGEHRVAITPAILNKVQALGATVKIQHTASAGIMVPDQAYQNGECLNAAQELYAQGKIILKVQSPTETEVDQMAENSVLISFLYPHLNPTLVKKLCERKITSFAMEMIPRISRAQSMDVLSSQATIAGYKAVLIAANACQFFFPMLTTAAGSIRPAKVLVIGAGVAGLQAIATAKRLGAIVEAYDVRSESKEQVESLGARFVQTGIQASGTGGYARELTLDEKNQQRTLLQKHVADSNVVITTAGVPGKTAPKIIFQDMIESMKPGSVIVDIMAEMGGNCDLVQAGITNIHQGVKIIGTQNIYSDLALHASEMYARNLLHFLELILQQGELQIDWTDEIIKGAVITREGQIVNERIQKLLEDQL